MSTVKRKCKVVMLATNEKASRICKCIYQFRNSNVKHGDLILTPEEYQRSDEKFTNQHLYILSNEDIKEGDWFIANQGVFQCLEIVKGDYPYKVSNQYNDGEIQYQSKHWLGNKIIATTDTSIAIVKDTLVIKQPRGFNNHYPTEKRVLPQPSPQFITKYIEEYNKGNIITDAMVDYKECGPIGIRSLKHELWNELKLAKDNTITITKVKDSWTREEHKQDLIYCVSEIAAKLGYGSTSKEMKMWNDETNKWIEDNI